jgi:HD superfamily phosphohydrolase
MPDPLTTPQATLIQIPAIFHEICEMQDDVFEPSQLSALEIDLIGAPEFQRLFRVSQMGFVDLVYPSANHTRGIHSIGCCSWAKKLVAILNQNADEAPKKWRQLKISASEAALISIGALLHDLSHGPFAHDIEKKTHLMFPFGKQTPIKTKSAYGPYEKHDDYINNPVLYITLLDPERSIVARVLRRHSPEFWALMRSEAAYYPQLFNFVEHLKAHERNRTWPDLQHELLPQLVFHLFAFEKFQDGKKKYKIKLSKEFESTKLSDWGLGPSGNPCRELHQAWYQPYRHDIIGDTLSADLLDYLHRDLRRLGLKKELDLRLLKSYVMIPVTDDDRVHFKTENESTLLPDKAWYRCALDLEDSKRGNERMERLNDLFRLLDLRHEIHEKAVFHRIVQSGIAMLSRAVLRLPPNKKPSLREMYGFDRGASPAINGDDHFLARLIEAAKGQREYNHNTELINQSLPQKLAERRVYRPLMVVPGDRVKVLLDERGDTEAMLRELGAIVDSEHFKAYFCFISSCIDEFLQHTCDDVNQLVREVAADDKQLETVIAARPPKHVIFWVLPYKQLFKDPEIVIRVEDHVTTIDDLLDKIDVRDFVKDRIRAGLSETETKYTTLWKFYVFLSDGLFYTGPAALLLKDACSDDIEAGSQHEQHLKAAQVLVIRALRAAWAYWSNQRSEWELKDKKKVSELLHQSSTTQTLKKMLGDFLKQDETDHFESIRQKVLTGRVQTYLHTRNPDGHITDGCRDIRYKYDAKLSGTFDEALNAFGLEDKSRVVLIKKILKASGRVPSNFGQEEFNYLVSRLAAAPKRILRACFDVPSTEGLATAARGEPIPINRGLLQRILRNSREDNNWELEPNIGH